MKLCWTKDHKKYNKEVSKMWEDHFVKVCVETLNNDLY